MFFFIFSLYFEIEVKLIDYTYKILFFGFSKT